MDVKDKIELRRHDEAMATMNKVAVAINSIQKEDIELKKLMSENRDAINKFVKAISELGKQEKQEVKVETNQDKVVSAITDLGKVMQGIGDRLTALEGKEERPLPVKLKADRNKFSGEIDYVIIEYKK
jgi:Mg2+ and Co2+ transporter CorA